MVQPFNFYLFTQEEWKHIYFYRMTCARMFIAALFIIVKYPKQHVYIFFLMDRQMVVTPCNGIVCAKKGTNYTFI